MINKKKQRAVKTEVVLPPAIPTPVLQGKDRITVQMNVYHESFGNQPYQISTSYSASLETIEQPYHRRTVIGNEWTPLDLAHLSDNPGLIVIENRTGAMLHTNPTLEERMIIDLAVLEIDLGGGPLLFVKPKRFQVLDIANPATIKMRSRQGECKIAWTIFPR